jgi:hypothetical protein
MAVTSQHVYCAIAKQRMTHLVELFDDVTVFYVLCYYVFYVFSGGANC